MKTKRIIVYLSIAALVGLLVWIRFRDVAPGAASDYKSATYTFEGQDITLINGISVLEIVPGAASKVTTRYFGNDVSGDFDGNGTQDIAFILTQDGGGSGTYYYVAAALKQDDGYRGTNAVLLGDRIAPQTTEFKDGKIIVNYADRKPKDAMTVKPSVGVTKYLVVKDGILTEVSK